MTDTDTVMPSMCVVSGVILKQALRATYIGLDFLLTLFGNILTIIVTQKVEEFSDSTKIFITSLALADLGVTVIAATSFAAEVAGGWPFPDWICVASFLCFYIFTAVSITMISILTFDRLVAVVKPLRHSMILNKKRSISFTALVWVACILGAIFTTVSNSVTYHQCSALCMTSRRSITQSIASVLAFYIIPLVCIMLMNIKLLVIARRHAIHFRRTRVAALVLSTPGQPKAFARSIRGKAVGVISLVTLAFALSWSFYQVKLIQGTFSSEDVIFPEWVEFTAVWLALTNSWWNVFIYSIMNRSFRSNMRSVLLRLCPWFRQQQETDPPVIS